MKFGLLLLFLFLCGFLSFEKILNEVKDEPTVGDDVDNDVLNSIVRDMTLYQMKQIMVHLI